MNKRFQYQKAESYYEEEPQEVANMPSQFENYNPMEDDGDLPYIPQLPHGRRSQQPKLATKPLTEGFVDMNNLEQYTASPQQGQGVDATQKFQQTYSQFRMEAEAEPSFMDAHKKFDQMKNVLGSIGQLEPDLDANQAHAIGSACDSIRKAIQTLKEVEYWLPKGKEEYGPRLAKISEPIVNALTAYVNKVEQLK
jgi:hypothetical protein